jgi:hypothetical protein
MRKTFFFQYNLPAENHNREVSDHLIDVVAEWDGSFMINSKPYFFVEFPRLTKADLFAVKNWLKVSNECEKIAEQFFAEFIKEEKLKQARAILSEFENPILERMAEPAY